MMVNARFNRERMVQHEGRGQVNVDEYALISSRDNSLFRGVAGKHACIKGLTLLNKLGVIDVLGVTFERA